MSDQYIGEIRLFSFQRIPTGWVPCNGGLLSIAEFSTLYTLLGTVYGGDGVTTFGVPDLRGQVPLHQGNGQGLTPRPIGSAGGSSSVTLTLDQLAGHGHPMSAVNVPATSNGPGNNLMTGAIVNNAPPAPPPPPADQFYVSNATTAPVQMNNRSVQPQGGNQPHENTMPTLVASYCIATYGVYPSPT